MSAIISAIRGPVITYSGKLNKQESNLGMDYEPDAIILMANGRITDVGPAYQMKEKVPVGLTINDSPSCRIIRISNK